MEESVLENFQSFKVVGLAVSLALVITAQLLVPNRNQLRAVLANWRVNVPLAVIDGVLLGLLCGACVCTWAMNVRESGLGTFDRIGLPYWFQVAITIPLLDLVAYLWHRANHLSRFLWRFHSVHHSDVIFEATTALRFHPGELLISLGIRLLVVTLTGLPLLGLILFEVIFGFFNLFVHSDLRLSPRVETVLSRMVITPSMHRLHHSDQPDELNTNFGTIFSVWDKVGRSFVLADALRPIPVGLPQQQGRSLSLGRLLALPFRK